MTNRTGRIDGLAKASGQAVYTDDLQIPGMVHAKLLRSPYPHARIVRIDTSEAEQVTGVINVVTGRDLASYNTYGRLVFDVPVLASDTVRFIGDRVAAVIAETAAAAEEAVALIRVDYEPLPALLDARDAFSPDAPVLHKEPWKYLNAGVTQEDHPNLQSRKIWGNADREAVESALAGSAHVFEHTFEAPARHQGYLETHICIASVEADRIDLWTPNKSPYALRSQIGRWLETDPEQIHVHPVLIGGDFGGKGSPMEIPLCICLSRIAGRPVKLKMSYAEDLMGAAPSHSAVIKVRLGVDERNRITAFHEDALVDGGAYAGFKVIPGALILGFKEAANSYRIPHCHIDCRIVYTNTVPRGHMRAPGSPPAIFASESIIDMAARQLGLDPVEFRRINLLQQGEPNPVGLEFPEVRGRETLDAALEEYDRLPQPEAPAEGNWAYGTGIAIYDRDTHGGKTEVGLEPHEDGSLTAWVGFPDQGAGQFTMTRNVVCEVLRLPADAVRVKQAELHQLAFDAGVGASRVTVTAAEALHNACERLLAELRGSYGLPAADYTPEQFAQAVARLAKHTGGAWLKALQDYSQMPHVTSYCVQIARVRVDRDTGEVAVEDLVTALDVADVVNPLSHQVQVEGGIVAGYADAMLLDLEIDGGKVTAANLGDYKLPSVLDLPRLTVRVLEGGIGVGKQNIKAIGELTTPAVGAAISNAIADAVGVRLDSLPLRAEKVFAALQRADFHKPGVTT